VVGMSENVSQEEKIKETQDGEVKEEETQNEAMLNEAEKVERIYEELVSLFKKVEDMIEKSDDFYEMLSNSIREIEFEDDYGEKYVFPFFVEKMYAHIKDMQKQIQEYEKELYNYKGELYTVIRFVELLRDKLNGRFNAEDLWDLHIKLDFTGGWLSVKDANNIILAHVRSDYFDRVTIQNLLESVVDLKSVRSAIMGILIAINLQKGADEYEGKVNTIRDYIEERLRDILKLF
jgi:hypothetical protein